MHIILDDPEKKFHILRDVSFGISKSEILGIVGESGSGKTILGKEIMGLNQSPVIRTQGEIYFKKNHIDKKKSDIVRGKNISMIFQNPMASLNPVLTIKNQLVETIKIHQKMSNRQAIARSIELLKSVEIDNPEERLNSYPHNLSGGMNQRVMTALAIASNPELLIADEPTTALDVTVQSVIMNLFKKLHRELGLSIILISHNIMLVQDIAHKIAVMYAGEILEFTSKYQITNGLIRHPYTKMLVDCLPSLYKKYQKLTTIPGEIIHNDENFETSCVFANRCPRKIDVCTKVKPQLTAEKTYKCHNPLI